MELPWGATDLCEREIEFTLFRFEFSKLDGNNLRDFNSVELHA